MWRKLAPDSVPKVDGPTGEQRAQDGGDVPSRFKHVIEVMNDRLNSAHHLGQVAMR